MDMELESTGSTFRLRLVDTWGVGELRPCLTKIYMGSIYRLSCHVCSNFTLQFDCPTSVSKEDWQRLAPGSEFEFDAGVSQVTMPLNGNPGRTGDVSLEFLVARTRHDRQERSRAADQTVRQVQELIKSQPGQIGRAS